MDEGRPVTIKVDSLKGLYFAFTHGEADAIEVVATRWNLPFQLMLFPLLWLHGYKLKLSKIP